MQTKVQLEPPLTERIMENWNRFWFTPADPTVLGLMRLFCGMIVFYTTAVYTLTLEDFVGRDGWHDLKTMGRMVRDRPAMVESQLNGEESIRVGEPRTALERTHLQRYVEKYGVAPPAPYPINQEQEDFIDNYFKQYFQDPRRYNLPLPVNDEQVKYIMDYSQRYGHPPPLRYPKSETERKEIEDYYDYFGVDPRRPYAVGSPVWSIWFHVTDPTAQMAVHLAICLVMFLFMIGFCTRITSVLAWLGALFYIHRATMALFGFDTMINILLLYLAIGPSGAALSVDRLIARWWSTARPRVINRWRVFWGKRAVEIPVIPFPAEPPKSVGANFAIRMMQVHLCIIYLMAGLSKLQGASWWRGTAIWMVLANFEFAPLQYTAYRELLRMIAHNKLFFDLFITGGTYFTLFFEIGYAFLIWRRSTRWLMLSMAILLHGFIGVFMGLRTFTMVMLVMNLAFVRPTEVRWFAQRFFNRPKPPPPPKVVPEMAATAVTAVAPAKR